MTQVFRILFDLTCEMVEWVVVEPAGNVRLELRTPFSYLQDISEQVCNCGRETSSSLEIKTTSKDTGRTEPECSHQVLSSRGGKTRTHNLSIWNRMHCQLCYTPK
jgi:hypothetical protein